jgi:hypothetical protein
LSYFFGCFAQKLSRKFVYKCLYESLAISRNTTTEIWQPVWQFFVQNSGYTSFIRRFSRFATGLSQVVENSSAAALCHKLETGLLKINSIAAALSQQFVTDLLTSRCGPVRTNRNTNMDQGSTITRHALLQKHPGVECDNDASEHRKLGTAYLRTDM